MHEVNKPTSADETQASQQSEADAIDVHCQINNKCEETDAAILGTIAAALKESDNVLMAGTLIEKWSQDINKEIGELLTQLPKGILDQMKIDSRTAKATPSSQLQEYYSEQIGRILKQTSTNGELTAIIKCVIALDRKLQIVKRVLKKSSMWPKAVEKQKQDAAAAALAAQQAEEKQRLQRATEKAANAGGDTPNDHHIPVDDASAADIEIDVHSTGEDASSEAVA